MHTCYNLLNCVTLLFFSPLNILTLLSLQNELLISHLVSNSSVLGFLIHSVTYSYSLTAHYLNLGLQQNYLFLLHCFLLQDLSTTEILIYLHNPSMGDGIVCPTISWKITEAQGNLRFSHYIKATDLKHTIQFSKVLKNIEIQILETQVILSQGENPFFAGRQAGVSRKESST